MADVFPRRLRLEFAGALFALDSAWAGVVLDEVLWVPDSMHEVLSGCPTASTTIAVVDDPVTARRAESVVARLAGLAVRDELVVVYGCDDDRPQRGLHTVMAGLRARLPRHKIVTVHVESAGNLPDREAATVRDLLEEGSLPVVVSRPGAVRDLAAEIAGVVDADRVLGVSHAITGGATLRCVWDRRLARFQLTPAAS
jgi:hypothetical protein